MFDSHIISCKGTHLMSFLFLSLMSLSYFVPSGDWHLISFYGLGSSRDVAYCRRACCYSGGSRLSLYLTYYLIILRYSFSKSMSAIDPPTKKPKNLKFFSPFLILQPIVYYYGSGAQTSRLYPLGRGSGLDRRSLMMLTTASPSLAPVLATPALFPIALLESSSVNKSARRNTNCILISQINKFYSFHAQGNYPLESFLLKITLYLNRVIKVIRRVFIHLLSMFKLWFHFTIR